MADNQPHKIFRGMAWGTGLLLGLLLALHLMLPYVVNTQGMRARILSLAARSVPGDIDFQHLKPALLPWPHAVLTQGRVTVSDQFSLKVDEIGVYPKLWPLLLGRLQFHRLRVIHPSVVIRLPLPDSATKENPENGARSAIKDRIAAVLAIVAPALGGIDVDLKEGRLELQHASKPPITLNQFDLRASVIDDWLNIDLQARSDMSRKLALQGKFNLATLDGDGRIHATDLRAERVQSLGLFTGSDDFPEISMDLNISLETRKLETAEARFTARAPVALLKRGERRLVLDELTVQGRCGWTPRHLEAEITQLQTTAPAIQLAGSLDWPLKNNSPSGPIRVTIQGTDLNLGPLHDKILELLGDIAGVEEVFHIVRDAQIPEIAVTLSAPVWRQLGEIDNIRAEARVTHGRLIIPDDLLHIEAVRGKIALVQGELQGENIAARLGNSRADNAVLKMDLFKGTKAFRLETDLDADLSELPATLKKLTGSKTAHERLDRLSLVSGRAAGRFVLGDRLDNLSANLDMDADIQFLDAAVKVSGPIDGLPTPTTRAKLSVSGNLGPRAIAWLGRLGDLPQDLLTQGPLSIRKAEMSREESGQLGLTGEFTLGENLKMSTALVVKAEEFRLDQLHIEDAQSDARITLQHKTSGNKWDGRFKGRLHKATLDRIWPGNNLLQGRIEGDLQARVDMAVPGRSNFDGEIRAADVDLPLFSSGPIRILNANLEAANNRFAIRSAALTWQAQSVQLSGGGDYDNETVNLDLKLAARKLDVDKLLAASRDVEPSPKTVPSRGHSDPHVRGRLALAVDQLRLGGYRFSSLGAVVSLKDDQNIVDVAHATLCGIATPGVITFSKDGMHMAFEPHAEKSTLEETSACLAKLNITERMEGTMDLGGRLSSQGKDAQDLVKNLKGSIKTRIRDGKVYNIGTAGLFTNLLSYLSVNQLVKGGMPDLRKTDFFYNSIDSRLEFKDGLLRIEEGVMKSNSVNIVGDGRYDLIDNHMNLTLLVSPLTTVDWIVERLPIVGRILKGTLVAIPVGVKGPAANPVVTPLAPSAVGSRVGGILKRTIETPYRIIEPILPGGTSDEED